jgi:Secretion system C-terminal sorting domain
MFTAHVTNFYWSNDMKILILLTAFFPLYSFAQIENPLEYFPTKTGNMWEYYFDDLEYPDTEQVFNINKFVDSLGNIYLTQSARRIKPIQYPILFHDTMTYKIDTSYNVFGPYLQFGPDAENMLLYKLNAKQGDQWILRDYSQMGGGYEIARVAKVWGNELFFGSGIFTTFKAFVYFYAPDSTDTLGLSRYGDVLTYGFGLRSRGGGDLPNDDILRGCVINDTLYGDTTNIITSIKDLAGKFPEQLELFQNYPNPFNPSTTISFNLKSSDNISVIVYDALGREIKRLIYNEWLNNGIHKIIWDAKSSSGSTVSSGVYFYVLTSNDIRITRSMIFLK